MKKKEFHVLYIITKLELGGAQKVCLALFEGLIQQGYTAALISGSEGLLVDAVRHKQHVYLLEGLKREVSLKTIVLEIKNFFSLITHIKRLKKQYPDLIVHTHSTKAGLIGRWAALCAGIATRIHTVHGFGFHPFQNRIAWWINFVAEYITSFITTHYICVSSADVKTGISLFPFFAKKHSIIRAAIDPASLGSKITPDNPPTHIVFGSIACFKKQKNLLDLLAAFRLCKEKYPSCSLEIIGDGHLRAQLQAWIDDHHMQESITLPGWQANVGKYMQQWNAFVLSSLWEGLPCAVVEARALGLPVIAYDTGGIHDIIRHEHNGFLVKPHDVQGLGQAMTRFCTQPDTQIKLTTYRDNLNDFYNPAMITQHIQLYQSL